MPFFLNSACLCHSGLVRLNNEDNFLFNQILLDEKHHNMESPLVYKTFLNGAKFFAIFDGMGGEAKGEVASYTAAQCAKKIAVHPPTKQDTFLTFLNDAYHEINQAVFHQAEQLCVNRMGSTMAMLCLKEKYAYVSNLGDSKVFRLRDGILEQLSIDHTDAQELKKRGINRKPRLTQHLGIDPNEMIIEPYVTSFVVKRKDYYLLCSDGLTDMLCNEEIQHTIKISKNVVNCVEQLVQKALDNGGKDNITVISCQII